MVKGANMENLDISTLDILNIDLEVLDPLDTDISVIYLAFQLLNGF